MNKKEKLLDKQEVDVCEQISSRDNPDGNRAKALLCLNEGLTQSQTAEKTGLSKGQISYLLRVFRQKRLGIFTAEETKQAPSEKAEKGLKKKKKKDKKKDKSKKSKKKKDKKKAGKKKKKKG